MLSNGTTARFTPTASHLSPGIVTIVRPLSEAEADAEVGQMYAVRYPDGTTTDAFDDELTAVSP